MCLTFISRNPWPDCDKTSPDVAGVTRWWEKKEHGRTVKMDRDFGRKKLDHLGNLEHSIFSDTLKETLLMERNLLKTLDWSLMKKIFLLLKLMLCCHYRQNSICSYNDFINFVWYPSEVNKRRDEREREVARHSMNKQDTPQHHPATADDAGEISVHEINNNFGKCIIFQPWSTF